VSSSTVPSATPQSCSRVAAFAPPAPRDAFTLVNLFASHLLSMPQTRQTMKDFMTILRNGIPHTPVRVLPCCPA
jgi:hypothetical protein